MIKLETHLVKIIKEALNKAFPEMSYDDARGITLEIPKEKKFGDFSVNIAMRLSKEVRKLPMDIALSIIKQVEKSDFIKDIKIEKPGFINFYISNKGVIGSL